MKPRNHTLARVAKEDPKRYRTRTVLSEKEKRAARRARAFRTDEVYDPAFDDWDPDPSWEPDN